MKNSIGHIIQAKSLRQDFFGCVCYVLSILVVVYCVIHAAKRLHPQFDTWSMIESFFLCHPVIASIVGTMIGLALTFFCLRPKLILKKVYLYHKGTEDRLSICMANWGIFPAHDIKVSVFWVRKCEPNNSKFINDYDFQKEWKTQRIDFFRPEMNAIDGIFGEHNTYSCHGNRSFALDIANRYNTYGDNLLCRVQATHSLSGLSRVYEWYFKVSDIEGIKSMSELISPDELTYKVSVNPRTENATIEKYEENEIRDNVLSKPTVVRHSPDGQG